MKNNSEAVFQTIGDYPVVDQFDVLYTGLLSGSYNDNYVTGSLFAKIKIPGLNTYVTTFGVRGLAFNRLGTNRSKFPGSNTSYELQSWGERSGFVRNLRIFSSSERYKDSQVPKIEKLIEVLGGSIASVAGTNSIISIGVSGSTGSAKTALSFHESFPFEGKFEGITRIKNIERRYSNLPTVIIEEGKYAETRWWNSYLPIDYVKEKDIGQILFGFGDRRKTYEISPGVSGSQSYLPDRRKLTSVFGVQMSVGPIIRGWKYGLINAMPYYTSAVFRRDRFGQFRDMLEQRPVIVSAADQVNSPTNYFGDTELRPISISPYPPIQQPVIQYVETSYESVVKVSFVKPSIVDGKLTNVSVNPSNTFSSNLSTYVTSSIPFFDNEQPLNVPEGNPGYWQEISLLPDVFNNQVVGGINQAINAGGLNVGG